MLRKEMEEYIFDKLIDYSALILPNACIRYKLSSGETSEAFRSKRIYIEKRLAEKTTEELNMIYKDIIKEENKVNNEEIIFVSHTSNDIKVAEKLVDLIADMGINREKIFCYSTTDTDIDIGEDIKETIRKKFDNCKAFIPLISEKFYESIYCCGEMGIAWYKKIKIMPLILKDLDLSKINGFIDKTRIIGSITKKEDLNKIFNELGKIIKFEKIGNSTWERKRDNFIEEIIKKNYDNKKETEKSDTDKINFDLLSKNELMLLLYSVDSEVRKFGFRWKAEETIKEIEKWETEKFYKRILSSNYNKIITNLSDRKVLKVSETTSEGNPRLYELPIELYDYAKKYEEKIKNEIGNIEAF